MRDEPAITLVTNDWEPMTPTLMVITTSRLPVPWDFPVRMSVCRCLPPRMECPWDLSTREFMQNLCT